MQTINKLPRFYVLKTGHLNYQENYALKLSLPVASLDVIYVHFKKYKGLPIILLASNCTGTHMYEAL